MAIFKRIERVFRGKKIWLEVKLGVRKPMGEGEEPPEVKEEKAPTKAEQTEIDRAYGVLELSSGAEWEQVVTNYRTLCRKYHPDRFHGKPEDCKNANDLMAEINAAYQLLEKHYKN